MVPAEPLQLGHLTMEKVCLTLMEMWTAAGWVWNQCFLPGGPPWWQQQRGGGVKWQQFRPVWARLWVDASPAQAPSEGVSGLTPSPCLSFSAVTSGLKVWGRNQRSQSAQVKLRFSSLPQEDLLCFSFTPKLTSGGTTYMCLGFLVLNLSQQILSTFYWLVMFQNTEFYE